MAYDEVVYLRGIDSKGTVHTSLVMAKTNLKVDPIKRITIDRLELCGALVLAWLLKQTSTVLNVPKGNI